MRIALDIETRPNAGAVQKLIAAMPEPTAPKTWKDPVKIKEYVESARQKNLAAAHDQATKDPFLGHVASCVIVDLDTTGELMAMAGPNEVDIVRQALQIVNSCDLLLTFNGIRFDIPWLWKRALVMGLRASSPVFTQSKYARRPHFDIRAVLGGDDRFAPGTLPDLARSLGLEVPKPHPLPVLLEHYRLQQWDDILEINRGDVTTLIQAACRFDQCGLLPEATVKNL